MYYSNYLTATLSFFHFAPVNTLPSFYKSLSHFCVFFSPFLGELLGLIWALCVTTSLEPVFASWWAQKRVHKSRQRPSFSQTKVFRGGVGSHKPAPCSWLMVEKANLVQSCYRQVRAAAMSSTLHWLFPFGWWHSRPFSSPLALAFVPPFQSNAPWALEEVVQAFCFGSALNVHLFSVTWAATNLFYVTAKRNFFN